MSPEEIARYRAETGGTPHVLHFNNAGASLMPDNVFEAVSTHLQREREIGGYEARDEAADRIKAFYAETAALIGAKPTEIAYIENATRAWDMAFYSLPLSEGDTILTARSEYSSNYMAYLQLAKRKGVNIRVVPDDNEGQVDVAQLERLIDRTTKLISITHIPTHGGLVNPARDIGRIARNHGITYLLDACQSIGQLDVNVDDIGCDILSATGRKFLRGPRGTGFLYMKQSLADSLEPVFVDLHSADWITEDTYRLADGAQRFENWECYYAGKLGLAQAIRYARSIGLKRIESRVLGLAKTLRENLSGIRGIEVTDVGHEKCAIVTFRHANISADAIHQTLRGIAINVSVSRSNSQRLDLPARGIDTLVRASVHYYNTQEEITRFCEAVAALPAAIQG